MDSKVKNIHLKVSKLDLVSTDLEMDHGGGEMSVEEALIGTACEKDICKNCFEYFYDFHRFMSETLMYLCITCGAIFVPPGIAVSETIIDKITKRTTQSVPESRHPPSLPYNVGSHDHIPVLRSPSPESPGQNPSDEDEDNDDDNACVDVTTDDDDGSYRAPVLKSPNDPVVGVKTLITGAVSSTPIVTTSKKGKPLLRLSIPNTCRDRKIINGNVPAKQELKEATVQSFSNLIKSSEVTKFYVRVGTASDPDQNSRGPAGPVKEGMKDTKECDYRPVTESGGSSHVSLLKDAGQPEKRVVSDTCIPGITEYTNQPDGHSGGNSEDVLLKGAKCVMSDTIIPDIRECKSQLEGDSVTGRQLKVLLKDVGHMETFSASDTSISCIPECKNQLERQSVIRSELKVLLKDIRHTGKVSGASMPDITVCKSKPEREAGGSSKQGLPEDTSDTEDCILSDICMPDIRECKYHTEREPGDSSEQTLPEDRNDTEERVMSDTSMPDITVYKYQPAGEPGGRSEQVLSEETSDTEECVMSDSSMPDITQCKYQPEGEFGNSSEQGLPEDMSDTEECVMSDTSMPDITEYKYQCPLPSNCIPVTVAMFNDKVATEESPKAETGENSGGGVFEDKEHSGSFPCFTANEPEIVVVENLVQDSMEHTEHLEKSNVCKNETVKNSAPDVIRSTDSIAIFDLKCQNQVQVQDKTNNENQPVTCKSQQELQSVTHLPAVTGIKDLNDAGRQVIIGKRQVEESTVVDTVEESTVVDMVGESTVVDMVGESTVTDTEVNVYDVEKVEEVKKMSYSEIDSFMDTLELGSGEFIRKTPSGPADHSYSHQSRKTPVARVTRFPRQKSAYKMTSATKVLCALCRKTFPSSSKCFEHVRKVHFLVGTHLNIKQRRLSGTRVKLRVESKQYEPSQITEEVSQELTSQLAPEAYLDAGLMAKLTEAAELRHKFICGICKEGFMAIELVNQHSQIQHPGEIMNVIQVQLGHVCEFCGKEEETKAKLQKHYKTHYEKYMIVCELCKKEFCTISAVQLHAKTVHPTQKFVSVVKKRKTFKCKVCGKKVTSKHSLIQHMRIHTGECPYACDICGKKGKTRGSILRHKRCVHPTEEDKIAKAHQPTFACTYCHKEVKSKASLKQHMRLHTGEKPYQCGVCGMCYASRSVVNAHIKRVHEKVKPKPSKNNIFTCEECGKQLTTNKSLNEHMLIHTGETPHACPHCDRRFRAKSSLRAHIRRHTEKQFKCVECGKAFIERFLLKQHMNVHTKEQSDQCSYCGKVFYDTGVFKQHVRKAHEKGDKYQCNVCNKKLNCGFSLLEHMRVHSGDRPHSCNVCSRKFKTLSACRAHEKRHSIVGNVYECPKCSKGFRTKHGFQKHVRNNCYQFKQKQQVKKFQCVYCEKKYFSEEKLRKHTARHVVESSSEEEPNDLVSGKSGSKTKCYSCPQCEKQYKTASGLRKHKEKHEKEEEEEGVTESEDEKAPSFMQESRSSRKQYECGHCGKEYKNKKSLKKHEQKHVEELSSENENDKDSVEEESLLDDWNI